MKKLYAIIISLLFVGSIFGVASLFGAQYKSFGVNTYRVYDADYNWIEIKDTGTEVTGWLGLPCWGGSGPDSDDGYVELASGFGFPFYGKYYDKFYLSTNGHIDFTQGCGNVLNNWKYGLKIPQPSQGSSPEGNDWPENPFIGVFFCDLDPSSGGHVYYQTFGDYFVVEYYEVPMFWDSDSYNPDGGTHTMQVILYKDGNIKMQFKDISYTNAYNGAAVVVGLDLDATTGVSYDGEIKKELAILFAKPSKSLPIAKILEIVKKNQEED